MYLTSLYIIIEVKSDSYYGNSNKIRITCFLAEFLYERKYFIKGRMSSGYCILMDIEGNKIDFSCMPKGYKTPKLSNCKRIQARTSQMVERIVI
jgi:hypothetical protein